MPHGLDRISRLAVSDRGRRRRQPGVDRRQRINIAVASGVPGSQVREVLALGVPRARAEPDAPRPPLIVGLGHAGRIRANDRGDVGSLHLSDVHAVALLGAGGVGEHILQLVEGSTLCVGQNVVIAVLNDVVEAPGDVLIHPDAGLELGCNLAGVTGDVVDCAGGLEAEGVTVASHPVKEANPHQRPLRADVAIALDHHLPHV